MSHIGPPMVIAGQFMVTDESEEATDASVSERSEVDPPSRNWVQIAITASAMLLALAHQIWPQIRIDGITVGLVVCAALPWLGSIFKSIDLPGIGKFEFLRREIRSLQKQVQTINQFVFSGLTPSQERRFRDALGKFRSYLSALKLPPGKALPHVRKGTPDDGSYYRSDVNEIVTSDPFVDDTDELLREYAHHVLFSHNDHFAKENKHEVAIKSGLAYYFVCSFSDDPIFGEKIDPAYLKQIRSEPYLRNLDNDRPLGSARANINEIGEAWGGAFWKMRKFLGNNSADLVLAETWRRANFLEKGDRGVGFVTQLLKILEMTAPDQTNKVRHLFKGRGLDVK